MMRRVDALQARVMFSCNNACFFCLDRSEVDGLFHGGPAVVPFAHVERTLRAKAGEVDTVIFTHGEPTLHPQLPELVELAAKLGYRKRGLVSNGRRLSVPAYADRLLDAGINRFVLSIHGPDAATHDACVGRKAFAQASAGLANLAARKDDYDFELTTSTVVNHLNKHRVADTVRFVLEQRVDVAVLNVVRPMGNAARFFASVVPRYREVVDALERLFALEPAARHRVAIEDIPPCAAQKVAPMLGVLESWTAEITDESPIAEAPLVDLSAPPEFEVGIPGRDAVKREACATCAHDGQCWGVWRRYIDHYGWDEFQPVSAEAQRGQLESAFVAAVHATAPVATVAAAIGPAWSVRELTLDERRERALYDLQHTDGRTLQLGLQPRDEKRPAFARSRRFNLSYQQRDSLAKDEVAMLRKVCLALDAASGT